MLVADDDLVADADLGEADFNLDETDDYVTTIPYESDVAIETKSDASIVPTTDDAIVATSHKPTVAGVSFQVDNCVGPAAVTACDFIIM